MLTIWQVNQVASDEDVRRLVQLGIDTERFPDFIFEMAGRPDQPEDLRQHLFEAVFKEDHGSNRLFRLPNDLRPTPPFVHPAAVHECGVFIVRLKAMTVFICHDNHVGAKNGHASRAMLSRFEACTPTLLLSSGSQAVLPQGVVEFAQATETSIHLQRSSATNCWLAIEPSRKHPISFAFKDHADSGISNSHVLQVNIITMYSAAAANGRTGKRLQVDFGVDRGSGWSRQEVINGELDSYLTDLMPRRRDDQDAPFPQVVEKIEEIRSSRGRVTLVYGLPGTIIHRLTEPVAATYRELGYSLIRIDVSNLLKQSETLRSGSTSEFFDCRPYDDHFALESRPSDESTIEAKIKKEFNYRASPLRDQATRVLVLVESRDYGVEKWQLTPDKIGAVSNMLHKEASSNFGKKLEDLKVVILHKGAKPETIGLKPEAKDNELRPDRCIVDVTPCMLGTQRTLIAFGRRCPFDPDEIQRRVGGYPVLAQEVLSKLDESFRHLPDSIALSSSYLKKELADALLDLMDASERTAGPFLNPRFAWQELSNVIWSRNAGGEAFNFLTDRLQEAKERGQSRIEFTLHDLIEARFQNEPDENKAERKAKEIVKFLLDARIIHIVGLLGGKTFRLNVHLPFYHKPAPHISIICYQRAYAMLSNAIRDQIALVERIDSQIIQQASEVSALPPKRLRPSDRVVVICDSSFQISETDIHDLKKSSASWCQVILRRSGDALPDSSSNQTIEVKGEPVKTIVSRIRTHTFPNKPSMTTS